MKKIQKLSCIVLVLVMVLSMVPSVFAEHLFVDVPDNCWYERAVDYCSSNGLLCGINSTTFGPDVTMTRAMLVTVLYKLEGKPDCSRVHPFTDVADSAYYADAVAWTYLNHLVNGTSESRFSPNHNISREQLVTMLYRYAEYKNLDVQLVVPLEDYEDAGYVSRWAFDAFQWAIGAGLIHGVPGNRLDPKGYASRAQVALILMRFCNLLENQAVGFYQVDVGENESVLEEMDQRGNIGRLWIPSLGVDVALFEGNDQEIVDREDSACYIHWYEQNVIGDHNYQGFDAIKSAVPNETRAYICWGTWTEEFACTANFRGYNTGGLTDLNGNSLACENVGGITMYTCNETKTSVTITYWQPGVAEG